MALDTGTHDGSIPMAAAAVFAAKYLVMKQSAEGTVAICGVGDIPFGTNEDVPDAIGDVIPVKPLCSSSTHKVVSGAAVAFNTYVKTNAAGKVIAKSADDDVICFLTMQAASGADEVIEAMPVHFIFPQPAA